MTEKIEIDQRLKVALQAQRKNNVFIYHAPSAQVADKINNTNHYSGATQMLYAIFYDLLDEGITYQEFLHYAKTVLLKAAWDKFGTKLKAMEMLEISKGPFDNMDLKLLENL